MPLSPRGFKFKTILDHFAWDLLLILREALCVDTLDLETLHMQVLMTLSDVRECSGARYRPSYVDKLLFRDFNAPAYTQWHTFHLPASDQASARTIKLHEEAITYFSQVLERRLSLAQNLKDKPTNAHQLYRCFARHSSCHPDWQQVVVARRIDPPTADSPLPGFHKVATRLAELIARLGDQFGEVSVRRRQVYGPVWLRVGECIAEMPEELSLFEGLSALPLSLKSEFFQDSELQKYLARVMDSLNERYTLLRSVGLPPKDWLERGEPSIAVLRELKQLRSEAESLLRAGQTNQLSTAYQQAFERMLQHKSGKKLAGCRDFEAFARSEYGRILLCQIAISLEASSMSDADHDAVLYDVLPGKDFDDEQLEATFNRLELGQDWVEILMKTYPEGFTDSIMQTVFREVIGDNRDLEASAASDALLQDQAFRKRLRAHPYYRQLPENEWAEALIEQASDIIEKGLEHTMATGGAHGQ